MSSIIHILSKDLWFDSSSNSTLDSSTCFASIPVFLTYSDFTAFLASGFIANANALYCLPPASSIMFNVSADDQDFHYFVGLKGFQSATVSITSIENIIRYDVTKLTTTTICTFPTPRCSVTLDHHGNVCILAYLNSKNLISLNFGAKRSSKHLSQEVFSWIALGSYIVPIMLCITWCVLLCKSDTELCKCTLMCVVVSLFFLDC